MNASSLSRFFRLGCVWLLATLAASASDVSGVYHDKGSVISNEKPELAGAEVSLHALLSQEFDPETGRILYAETERLDLIQTSDDLTFRAHKEKTRVSWSVEYLYEAVKGSVHGPRVIVNLRKPEERDVYTYVFELLENKDHLLITVYRVTATIVGPSGKPIGSYLFERMAESK